MARITFAPSDASIRPPTADVTSPLWAETFLPGVTMSLRPENVAPQAKTMLTCGATFSGRKYMVTAGKNVSAHSGDVTSSVGGRIEATLGAKVIRAIGVARIHCADSLPLGTVH